MNKIGIYGGSFDPIHIGHLITAQRILEIRELSKIIFVPCHISPHKPSFDYSSGEHRSKMISLAIESIPHFEVSDFEVSKGDISYSIDTIRHFKQSCDNIELIIGFDNLISFDTWREPDNILKLAELIVLKRKSEMDIHQFHKYYGEAVFVDTPVIEISSTEIRKRIKENQSIDFLVTEKVKDYIYQNGLYKR